MRRGTSAHESRSVTSISRTNGTRSSGQSGPRSARTSTAETRRSRTQARAFMDTDTGTGSHGVSDPSGQARGHFQRAHRGRSRHGLPASDRDTGACSGRQRAPPIVQRRRACSVWKPRRDESVTGVAREKLRSRGAVRSGGIVASAPGGQPHFPRSSPRSSSAVGVRRRQPGERDAGTAATARRIRPVRVAVDGVGHDRRAGHPERVPGIVQPLSVERSIPRRAVGAGGVEVACVSRRGARFGEPLPFGKQPLQRLHHRRVQWCREVLPGSVQVGQSGLRKLTRKIAAGPSIGTARGAAAHAAAGTAGSPSARDASRGRRRRGCLRAAASRSAACRGSTGPPSLGPHRTAGAGSPERSSRSPRCRMK